MSKLLFFSKHIDLVFGGRTGKRKTGKISEVRRYCIDFSTNISCSSCLHFVCLSFKKIYFLFWQRGIRHILGNRVGKPFKILNIFISFIEN
jgi:hypothetical protein